MLGALTYGQLRSFEVVAHTVAIAPDVRIARRFADVAIDEHRRFTTMYAHLAERTDLADAVMQRQRGAFDEFFDDASLDLFPNRCVLFAVGLPLTADFIARIAPSLPDPVTAGLVRDSLSGRDAVATFATEWLREHMGSDEVRRGEVQRTVAELTGRALTSFQRVIQDTDALAVLLTGAGDDVDADRAVRDVVVEVLAGHRRRLAALGLGDPA